jgi:hypothetical protein
MEVMVFENGISKTCYDCLDLFLDIGGEAVTVILCNVRSVIPRMNVNNQIA